MVVRKRRDVATAAKLGRWRDPTVLLRRYAHALDLDTTAETVFRRNNTSFNGKPQTHGNPDAIQRVEKSA
jgi:hypothetical protein